jgi:hypothetical protein
MLVAEILIEVDVAQLQLKLAVIDKPFCTGAGQRQQTEKGKQRPLGKQSGHSELLIVVIWSAEQRTPHW